MGVDSSEPNTPPFVMVKVPPVRSSMAIVPSRAFFAYCAISFSMSASSSAAIAAGRADSWGGVVVFLGTVRDTSRGKRVTHLEYEAYPEMAEEKMREIARRLEAKYAPCRLVLHHRVGDLAIGDIAVERDSRTALADISAAPPNT